MPTPQLQPSWRLVTWNQKECDLPRDDLGPDCNFLIMMINIASPPRPQALDLGGLEELPGVCEPLWNGMSDQDFPGRKVRWEVLHGLGWVFLGCLGPLAMTAISNAISAADSGPWQPTPSLFLPITSTSSRKSETRFRDVWLLSLVCFSPSKGLLSDICGVLCCTEDRQTSPEL